MVWHRHLRGYTKDMTVCIAAKADNGDSLVLAADQLATNFGVSRKIDGTEKILKLKDNVYLLLSGDDNFGREVFKVTAEALAITEGGDTFTVDQCTQVVRNAFAVIRNRLTEDLILRTRGLSHEEYLDNQQKLHKDTAFGIDNALQTYEAPATDVIVAGLDPDGSAHIYTVSQPGVYLGEAIAFNAVGVGATHATSSLFSREYKPSQTLEEATYLTYEAKKVSEVAPGVGDKTSMIIITKNGVEVLNQAKLNELQKIFDKVQKENQATIDNVMKGFTVEKQQPPKLQ